MSKLTDDKIDRCQNRQMPESTDAKIGMYQNSCRYTGKCQTIKQHEKNPVYKNFGNPRETITQQIIQSANEIEYNRHVIWADDDGKRPNFLTLIAILQRQPKSTWYIHTCLTASQPCLVTIRLFGIQIPELNQIRKWITCLLTASSANFEMRKIP